MKVGIRELKARLSEYIERAERGEVIDVTSRGRPVAQIGPVVARDNIERGLAEGWITRAENRPPRRIRPFQPRAGTPTTTDVIRADRDA